MHNRRPLSFPSETQGSDRVNFSWTSCRGAGCEGAKRLDRAGGKRKVRG